MMLSGIANYFPIIEFRNNSVLLKINNANFNIGTTLIFFLIFIVLTNISWRHQGDIADIAAQAIAKDIAEDFNRNENFSDAVSVLLLRSAFHGAWGGVEYDERDEASGLYGFNLGGRSSGKHGLEGTLQSLGPVTKRAWLVARSIDEAYRLEQSASSYSNKYPRYFISAQGDYIYFPGQQSLEKYRFRQEVTKRYGMLRAEHSGGFLFQKLQDASRAITGHIDRVQQYLNGERSIMSVQHVVYDQSSRETEDDVIGIMCFDYSLSDVRDMIARAIGSGHVERYLNVSIIDHHGSMIPVNGDVVHSDYSDASINGEYQVRVSVNHLRYFFSHDGSVDTAIGLLLILGFIVMNLLHHRRIKIEASAKYSDVLTGLHNRAFLDDLKKKLTGNYVLVVMDCNDFKLINDTRGHLCGDRALQHVGRCITRNIRAWNDHAVRLGGDEFVILFATDNFHSVREKMERIARDIEIFEQGVALSVSYGLAALRPGTTFEAALDKADAQMYLSKRQSRGLNHDA
ncbi:diguanylate cyclase [Erwinia sp. CPCC 100877]|nr:diguanylate cyclase [Erwinia sp. CPCC 100877]